MTGENCWDRVRFTLSDKDGVLRFESVELVGSGECGISMEEVAEYMRGRPLAEVDLELLRSKHCRHGQNICMQAVSKAVGEYQELFCEEHSTGKSSTALG